MLISMLKFQMECFLNYHIKSNSLVWKKFEDTTITKTNDDIKNVPCEVDYDSIIPSTTHNSSIDLPNLIDFGIDDNS